MREQTPTIAIYRPQLYNTGVETVFANLSHGFINRGYKVHLILDRLGFDQALNKYHPHTTHTVLHSSRFFSRITNLKRHLTNRPPHTLLSAGHFPNEIATIARKLAKAPTQIILTEHSTMTHDQRVLPYHTPRRYAHLSAHFCYPLADHIIAVSQGVAKDLSHNIKYPLNNINIIYNPIITPDLQTLADSPPPHPWLEPSLTNHTPTLIAVGQLHPAKDYPNLIQAFHLIRQHRPARLLILGSGSLKQSIQSQINSLNLPDSIQLLGHVTNPYPYIKHASLLTLSSCYEGLPTVLVEALALNTPIASTDCPSGPSEITDQGKYAHLAPIKNPQALAHAIQQTIDSPLPPPPLAHLEQFTLDFATTQYLQLMNLPAHAPATTPTPTTT